MAGAVIPDATWRGRRSGRADAQVEQVLARPDEVVAQTEQRFGQIAVVGDDLRVVVSVGVVEAAWSDTGLSLDGVRVIFVATITTSEPRFAPCCSCGGMAVEPDGAYTGG
jgi:hypothetical protein